LAGRPRLYHGRFVPRIRATTMLGSPGGLSGGSGSRFGAGGSSLSRIAFQPLTRGLRGKLRIPTISLGHSEIMSLVVPT
jgi:hypothetical protein